MPSLPFSLVLGHCHSFSLLAGNDQTVMDSTLVAGHFRGRSFADAAARLDLEEITE